MPIVTFQSRLLINTTSKNEQILLLIQYAYELLTRDIAFRILSSDKLKTWDYLRTHRPEIVRYLDQEITNAAQGHLRSYAHSLKDLSERHTIKFAQIEAEVFEIGSIDNIDGLKLAIYYLSNPYNLISSFGSYVLIAEVEDKTQANTLMLELSPNLTIKSYL